MEPKTRRAEYGETTRRALMDAALQLFTERGYADSPTDEIVRRARVSRGGLYHHFADKRDLFQAVLEEVNEQLTAAIAERGLVQEDVWQGVVEGINAFLDGCLDPAYQQIVLIDGPAVLGWPEWRAIGEKHGLGLVRSVLQAAMDQGVVARQPIEPLASMLHAALNEAAMRYPISICRRSRTGKQERAQALEFFRCGRLIRQCSIELGHPDTRPP